MANLKGTQGDKKHDDGGGPIMEQIPVSTNKSTVVWIDDHISRPFLKIIVTNNRLVTGFDIDTEYWYTSIDTSIAGVSSITFRSQSDQYSEADLLAHVEGSTPAFSTRQTIGTAGWTEGTQAPKAAQARLYKAVDPDDATKWVGLLIEQDETNALTGITWYKQTNTTGTVFGRTPPSLSFKLVTREGSPSTSPSDVAPGGWYYHHAA